MTENIFEEHKPTKAELLQAKAKKYAEMAKKELKKESDRKRKERTHRLIKTGGIVEMVLGSEVDKGILTGLLLENKFLFSNNLTDKAIELKRKGDSLLVEKEGSSNADNS